MHLSDMCVCVTAMRCVSSAACIKLKHRRGSYPSGIICYEFLGCLLDGLFVCLLFFLFLELLNKEFVIGKIEKERDIP